MDTQLQSILNRIQTDLAVNARAWLPTPRRLDAESIVSALVVCLGFWAASIALKKVAEKFFALHAIDEALARFLIRAMRLSLIGLGVVTALGTLGVDVSAIVAGLGLTGLALGIALKDVVSNAVSGILLLLFRPFRHRDRIKVGEFEGEVHDIDLRYTHLKNEGRLIFVPNSMMFANAVSVLKSAKGTIAGDRASTAAPLTSAAATALETEPPLKKPQIVRRNPLLALSEGPDENDDRAVAA